MSETLKYKVDDWVIIKPERTSLTPAILEMIPENRRIKINEITTEGKYCSWFGVRECLIFIEEDIEEYASDQGPVQEGTLVRSLRSRNDCEWLTVRARQFADLDSNYPPAEARILLHDLGSDFKYRYICVDAEDEQNYMQRDKDIKTVAWGQCIQAEEHGKNTLKDGDYQVLIRGYQAIVTMHNTCPHWYSSDQDLGDELDKDELILTTWLGRIDYRELYQISGEISKDKI